MHAATPLCRRAHTRAATRRQRSRRTRERVIVVVVVVVVALFRGRAPPTVESGRIVGAISAVVVALQPPPPEKTSTGNTTIMSYWRARRRRNVPPSCRTHGYTADAPSPPIVPSPRWSAPIGTEYDTHQPSKYRAPIHNTFCTWFSKKKKIILNFRPSRMIREYFASR